MTNKWITSVVMVMGAMGAMRGVKAQEAPTLDVLAKHAIAKSYDLRISQLDIEVDKQTKKRIGESYLPRVEASGKYAYNDSEATFDIPEGLAALLNMPMIAGSNTFQTSTNLWSGDLNTSILLFSGTKVPKLSKAMGSQIKAKEEMLERQRQDIISEVSVAYDQLALLKQMNVVLQESETRLNLERKTVEKAFEYGLITSYELNKIDLAQATLAASRSSYEGRRELLLKKLHELTDVPMESLALINNDLDVYVIEQSSAGIAKRPELAALDAAVEAANYKVAAEKTYWLPQAKASAGVRYLGLTNLNFHTPFVHPATGQTISLGPGNHTLFPSYLVGIGFHWNIFDGLQGKREVRKARLNVQKAEIERQKVEELLELNLDKTTVEYRIANTQVEAGKKRMELAQKALEIAQKEYKVGLIKLTDRLAAENDYQKAAMDYLQAVFEQRRSAFNCLMATGELTIDKIKNEEQ